MSPSLRGILWMAASAVCFSCTFAFVRILAGKFHIFEVVLLRALIGLAFMLPWLARAGLGTLRTRRWRRYALRAAMAYTAMVFWFYALKEMRLADASALQFTMPLWSIVFAVALLREKAGAHRWIATVFGFAGALVIVRPGFVDTSLAAIAVLGSAALYAGTNILTKTLSREDDPTAIAFLSFAFALPFSLPAALTVWVTPDWADAPAIAGFGVVTVGAHVCLTRALAAADASVVGPVDYLRLPCVALIAYALWAEVPDIWTWAGAAIIVASTWYLTLRERSARAAAG
jgi:drug/metabolite transporter (DMT)-like permease